MDTSWLNVLSGLDKMVLGSIVGSVILAFLLLIVVFSVKIKSQQDRIATLREVLENCTQETRNQKDELADQIRKAADAQTVMEHYQQQDEQHQKTEASLRKELEKALHTAKELRQTLTELGEEKRALAQSTEKARQELSASQEEIQAVLKRNEFWVEQLSELRTKHEALKLKLRKMERTK